MLDLDALHQTVVHDEVTARLELGADIKQAVQSAAEQFGLSSPTVLRAYYGEINCTPHDDLLPSLQHAMRKSTGGAKVISLIEARRRRKVR